MRKDGSMAATGILNLFAPFEAKVIWSFFDFMTFGKERI